MCGIAPKWYFFCNSAQIYTQLNNADSSRRLCFDFACRSILLICGLRSFPIIGKVECARYSFLREIVVAEGGIRAHLRQHRQISLY